MSSIEADVIESLGKHGSRKPKLSNSIEKEAGSCPTYSTLCIERKSRERRPPVKACSIYWTKLHPRLEGYSRGEIVKARQGRPHFALHNCWCWCWCW